MEQQGETLPSSRTIHSWQRSFSLILRGLGILYLDDGRLCFSKETGVQSVASVGRRLGKPLYQAVAAGVGRVLRGAGFMMVSPNRIEGLRKWSLALLLDCR